MGFGVSLACYSNEGETLSLLSNYSQPGYHSVRLCHFTNTT